MPIIDTAGLDVVERLPGWRARVFHSEQMTFAHYTFEAGASIHAHEHPQEEAWHVLEGELEIVLDGETHRLGPGMVAIAPPGARHGVRALTAGRAIVVDHPRRWTSD